MTTSDPGAAGTPRPQGATDRPATDRPLTDRPATDRPVTDATTTERTTTTATADRKTTVAREKEVYGGVKVGSAFFGWLTATGMTVILTALVAAAGAGVGLTTTTSEVADAAADQGISVQEIGWAGVVLVLVVVFVAYYAGGYVAGRMARFNGARQGAAVFGWAVVIAVVVAILGAIGGAQFDVLGQLNSFPRLPSSLEELSLPAIVALVGVVAAALVGAVLGGLAGMHFHRKVDKVGLGR